MNHCYRSLQVKLLALLPNNWTFEAVADQFGASRRQISEVKNLRKRNSEDHSLLEESIAKKRRGNDAMNSDLEENVKAFYENEENSRTLAGKKDVKSVKQPDGTRKLIQKKLVLMNLKELYEAFKQKYSNDVISFSKFASLRPPHCILAGSSGTHTTCVCTVHQNVKLMLDGENFTQFVSSIVYLIT